MYDFLKHPKIQYIPLSVTNLQEGAWKYSFHQTPRFYAYQNLKDLSEGLSRFRLPEIELNPEGLEERLAIIALNFKVEKGNFRSLTAKLIGVIKKDYFQLFYITKKYFPKRILHFVLYTNEGEKITWENIKIL